MRSSEIHESAGHTLFLDLALVAAVLTAGSGVAGRAFGRSSSRGSALANGLLVAGSLVGVVVALLALAAGAVGTSELRGPLPGLSLHLRLDPLAAFFLVPVYGLGAASALFGVRYWSPAEHPDDGARLRLWHGILVAALAGVVLAADAIAFLFAWEIMALAAFFLITIEDEDPRVRQAGWVYLVATHVGTLALFAMFGLLWSVTGSLAFESFPPDLGGPVLSGVLFGLALLAFGMKAGIVPMHFWLPAAHAAAPAHASALLSGVLLKMGIYGLLRTFTLLPPPPLAVGLLLLGLGVLSALYGVLFALGQHDLKRLLAYHSIENIGIIVMGMGLALIGVSAGQPAWIVLGLGGCLLHVWNHALFKGLLFLAAGSAIHGAGTREIDCLGGLARRMPRTAVLFAVGAAAICGLPPLNGFVSELLIYVGLLRIGGDGVDGLWSVAPLAAPLLAMAGALAIACFVKAFGTVFLGPFRSEGAEAAHESPPGMIVAMGLLALGCIGIGVLPAVVMPLLDRVVPTWVRTDMPLPPLVGLVPWAPLMALNGALIAGVLAVALVLRSRLRRGTSSPVPTWDCGYARPTSTMAYTASSFADILVSIYGWLLRPHSSMRSVGEGVEDLFPSTRSFHSTVSEPILEGILGPFWAGVRRLLFPLRALQHGRLQQYLLYVFLMLCLLLASLFSIRDVLTTMLRW
jgi:hydrogenase-4 component B